jgi:hypothetical protein
MRIDSELRRELANLAVGIGSELRWKLVKLAKIFMWHVATRTGMGSIVAK